MTLQKKLETMMSWWSQRLGLREWKISVELVTHSEVDGHLAQATVALSSRRLRIRVATPESIPYRQTLRDLEDSIVHELLHATLDLMSRLIPSELQEDVAKMAVEWPIERLAETLVSLRPSNHKFPWEKR